MESNHYKWPLRTYGEAPPGRVDFFRFQVYERAGILLIEGYKRVGKSIISVCERPNMAKLMAFNGCEKVDKTLESCDLSGGHRLLRLFIF